MDITYTFKLRIYPKLYKLREIFGAISSKIFTLWSVQS